MAIRNWNVKSMVELKVVLRLQAVEQTGEDRKVNLIVDGLRSVSDLLC